MTLTYVLPLKSATVRDDLTPYLDWLADRAEVIVVDGSEPEVFDRHGEAWSGRVRHLPVAAGRRTPMGKVGGVLTGIDRATHPHVVVADDDVRYDPPALARIERMLATADVVIPQNVFTHWPWHARWDGARALVHRSVSVDWPGTLGVRRDALLATGGYAGDVMFENLELVRTVAAVGGRVVHAPDLFVGREPPTTRQFLSQRVRHAYDELARPWFLVGALAVAPAVALGRLRAALALSALALVAAAAGRCRAAGRDRFPADIVAFAPLWVLERAVTAWLALGARLFLGGIPYRSGVLRSAATPSRRLRRQLADVRFGTPA